MNRYSCLSKEDNMEKNVVKGSWHEIKGAIKEKWGKLTDDDITALEGKEEKLVGLLQKKYGYSKIEAERQYDEFMGRYKSREHAAR